MQFSAHTITGAGRGKRLEVPTINIELDDVPAELHEGIYACRVMLPNKDTILDAVLHYGPRPVFKDSRSCEVHILDSTLSYLPESITIEIVDYLREVADFKSTEALLKQIDDDIANARRILQQDT